jgi:hypothetical protein
VAVLLAAVILISVFHTKIINALKPFTDWLHEYITFISAIDHPPDAF